ncbi:MAG: SpoIIE family protein phosphatase [Acidobacteriia bacterium]|nr:SpoIIE family protein phosphatase [Terriglobia bacterium]
MNSVPASLLVVDDNEMNRDMLARRLERRGFKVSLAEDGHQAMELIRDGSFDLVLLDVMMPGVDGLQVLQQVRESRSVKDLPIIMATAKDRSEDVVRALELGANDYVTKPIDFPVVLARIQTQLSLKRATEQLEAAHARMKKDLEAASRIQHSLMPTNPPDGGGVRFAWSYRPCDELAGDILGIEPLDARHIAIYLLDVSGHGVPSALLAVSLHRLLSHTAEGSIVVQPSRNGTRGRVPTSPPEVVGHLNKRFPMNPETHQYFTLLYGVLDLESREFVFTSAGHPEPIHLSGAAHQPVAAENGFPVGWFATANYGEARVKLNPGDRLYLYSDGIVDAANAEAERFEKERLAATLAELGALPLQESVDGLIRKVESWSDGGKPDDDVSIVALEISPS